MDAEHRGEAWCGCELCVLVSRVLGRARRTSAGEAGDRMDVSACPVGRASGIARHRCKGNSTSLDALHLFCTRDVWWSGGAIERFVVRELWRGENGRPGATADVARAYPLSCLADCERMSGLCGAGEPRSEATCRDAPLRSL